MHRRSVIAVAGAMTMTVVLAACGSGSGGSGGAAPPSPTKPAAAPNGVAHLSATAAYAAMRAAMAKATSVHYVGHAVDANQTATFDVTAARNGDGDAKMHLDGQALEVRVVGANAYLHASQSFWRKSGPTAAALIDGRWVEVSKSSKSFAALIDFLNPSKIVKQDKVSALVMGKATTIEGQPVFALVDPRGGSEGGTVYVASTGAPLPVRAIDSKKPPRSRFDFSAWNAPVTVTAPPASQTVDLRSVL